MQVWQVWALVNNFFKEVLYSSKACFPQWLRQLKCLRDFDYFALCLNLTFERCLSGFGYSQWILKLMVYFGLEYRSSDSHLGVGRTRQKTALCSAVLRTLWGIKVVGLSEPAERRSSCQPWWQLKPAAPNCLALPFCQAFLSQEIVSHGFSFIRCCTCQLEKFMPISSVV